MNYVWFFWYLLMSILFRVLFVLTGPLAVLGWETPLTHNIFYVVYYDEMTTKAWDNEL